MENPVIIFGANTIGRIAQDIFSCNGVLVYGFLDERVALHNTELSDTLVLGDPFDDGFLKIIGNKTEAFVAETDKTLKKKIVEMLHEKRKTMPVNAISHRAYVSEDAELSYGLLIAPGAVINAGVKIAEHSIISSNAVLEPNVNIGKYVEIGVGANINAEVEIADEVFIGSGVVIVGGIKIGKGARIGAGSVVIADVEENTTVFGNPALPIKK